MKIGDLVMTKKLGLPTTGNIIGIVTSELFIKTMAPNPHMQAWGEQYPDWKDKLVILIQLTTPHKPISFDEFYNTNQEDISIEEAKVLYKFLVKPTTTVSNPIDDVEVLS